MGDSAGEEDMFAIGPKGGFLIEVRGDVVEHDFGCTCPPCRFKRRMARQAFSDATTPNGTGKTRSVTAPSTAAKPQADAVPALNIAEDMQPVEAVAAGETGKPEVEPVKLTRAVPEEEEQNAEPLAPAAPDNPTQEAASAQPDTVPASSAPAADRQIERELSGRHAFGGIRVSARQQQQAMLVAEQSVWNWPPKKSTSRARASAIEMECRDASASTATPTAVSVVAVKEDPTAPVGPASGLRREVAAGLAMDLASAGDKPKFPPSQLRSGLAEDLARSSDHAPSVGRVSGLLASLPTNSAGGKSSGKGRLELLALGGPVHEATDGGRPSRRAAAAAAAAIARSAEGKTHGDALLDGTDDAQEPSQPPSPSQPALRAPGAVDPVVANLLLEVFMQWRILKESLLTLDFV